ncbi:MAG: hypothetical protein QMD25_00480 [Caldisericia bacterium]|jgi:hypothetical protein|nr:hypothetical protein [Caldisericia bacterium]
MDIFISEKILVELNNIGVPVSFIWKNEKFLIDKILYEERKIDLKRKWYQRRHKKIYIVKTTEGRIFEIYKSLGFRKREWILYKELKNF